MNVLYVRGHPYAKSFHAAIQDAYIGAAKAKGHDIEVLNLGELGFDPVLRYGYHERMPEDADIVESQRLVKWADHIVFAYPLWWGVPPSLFMGWVSRVFTPGFSYRLGDLVNPGRFLAGKTADIIVTSRAPRFGWPFVGNDGVGLLTRNLFYLTGIKRRKVAVLDLMSLKPDTEKRRQKFLAKITKLAGSL